MWSYAIVDIETDLNVSFAIIRFGLLSTVIFKVFSDLKCWTKKTNHDIVDRDDELSMKNNTPCYHRDYVFNFSAYMFTFNLD